MLVIEAFSRVRFTRLARNTREFGDRVWTLSGHDLDFIYTREGLTYGVEVKNSLAYIREEELNIKMNMCEELGLIPLFIVRYMPTTWFNRVREAGGFVLMMKHQLYPLSHVELARAMREELGLPVYSPEVLCDSTIERFTNWHEARVNSALNSQI